jgi:protocatechuate 3,4-dioxygenase beta subunit
LFPPAQPTSPIGPPPQAVADEDGRFVFNRLAPGAYRIDAEKTGFVPLNGPGGARTVDVAAGQLMTILLQLERGGVVTGRVLDPKGEPLADASIVALRYTTTAASASRQFIRTGGRGGQTNDIGEYRLSGLAAGEYYIAAMPRGVSPFGGPGVTPPTGNARTAITATFYPGTADQAAAQPIAVAAGAEVGNISFTMQSAPAFRVSGIVVDENGDPVADAMVMMMGDPRSGMFMGPAGGGQSRADGRFTIGEVPAGTYRVTASIPIRMNSPGSNGGFVTFGTGPIVNGSAVSSGAVSSGAVSSGVVAGVTGGVVGSVAGVAVVGGEQPTEVVVTDTDVSGVRIVVRRPVAR